MFFNNNTDFSVFWCIILTILAIILLLCQNNKTTSSEGFSQRDKFVYYKDNDKIFDSFYSDIYDDLFYSRIRAKLDYDLIIPIAKFNAYSNILDAGCGTGYHIKTISEKKHIINGVDISQNMVTKARNLNKNIDIQQGDLTNGILYNPEDFTHILCLYFTIYYIEDKRQFFVNCYDWLQKDGMLIIHLVNRDMFDPILPASNPLYMISPQKYAKNRIVKSSIKFKDFEYDSKFHIDSKKDIAVFEETMKDDLTSNIRKNRHKLFMPTQKEILNLARQSGFTVVHKIDMISVQYEYQYLYFLQKE